MGIPLEYAMRGLESGVTFASNAQDARNIEIAIYEIKEILNYSRDDVFVSSGLEKLIRKAQKYAPSVCQNIMREKDVFLRLKGDLEKAMKVRKKEYVEAAKRAGIEIQPWLLKD